MQGLPHVPGRTAGGHTGGARGVHGVGDLVELVVQQVPVQVEGHGSDWWPSMVCTTLTFAPLAMASDVAVCRSAWG
jgi:hypothetical protein